jgi:ribonuclease D
MTNHSLPQPRLIETEAELRSVVNKFKAQPKIAMDTESNSLFAYQEQVCLIQISIPQEDYLIDTLHVNDLQSLRSIMRNPKIEKIFHAAEYDLICLKRDFDFEIRNIFDTRVAMRTLGYARTGLGNVLEDQFNVKVNKKWQRADWGQRPLPAELLDYARLDTHYLLPLRDRLAQLLEQAGRWDEAREEWERVSRIEPSDANFNPDRFWKINGARKLNPAQSAVLRELYLFREEQAQNLDRPPFKVFSDQTMLDIARELPEDDETLGTLQGMTSGQMRRYAVGLLEAIKRGLGSTPPQRPKTEHIKQPVAHRYKKLHSWRKNKAEQRKVESDVILPRDVVWDISRGNPQDLDQLHQIMEPLDWRFQTYGEEILQLLRS